MKESPKSTKTIEKRPQAASKRNKPTVGIRSKLDNRGIRALIYVLTLILCIFILNAPFHNYLTSREELNVAETEYTQIKSQYDTLQGELKQWDNKNYIITKARERLGYIMPGETLIRVVTPKEKVEAKQQKVSEKNAETPINVKIKPWYEKLAETITAADNATKIKEADAKKKADEKKAADEGQKE
ncbi:MAG: septum formation initiator family protein [Bifidobacteriaceae bacterium]|nr:septum formation initiator family protein [Bifidobacteriaceae bacterium]